MNSLLTKIRARLKENRVIYPLRTKLLNKDYRMQKKRMQASTVKTKEQIKREMKMYEDYWGVPAYEYVRYGLWEKQLTNEEILDYIPTQFFYCKYLKESYRDLKEDISVYDDKLNQYGIMCRKGIPTPQVHFVIRSGKLMTLQGEEADISALNLLAKEGEKIFIKPTDGRGGSGIIVLTRNGGGITA